MRVSCDANSVKLRQTARGPCARASSAVLGSAPKCANLGVPRAASSPAQLVVSILHAPPAPAHQATAFGADRALRGLLFLPGLSPKLGRHPGSRVSHCAAVFGR